MSHYRGGNALEEYLERERRNPKDKLQQFLQGLLCLGFFFCMFLGFWSQIDLGFNLVPLCYCFYISFSVNFLTYKLGRGL